MTVKDEVWFCASFKQPLQSPRTSSCPYLISYIWGFIVKSYHLWKNHLDFILPIETKF